jgi:hypothetical protein
MQSYIVGGVMLDSIAAGARPLLVVSTAIVFVACGVAPTEDPTAQPTELDAGTHAETAELPDDDDAVNFAPLVLFAQPSEAAEVRPDVVIKLMFNEPMDILSTTAAIAVSTKMGDTVSGHFAWDIGGVVVAFRPDEVLEPGGYQVVVDQSAEDAEGLALAETFYASFLVVADTGNPKYETNSP